jgi:signal transduction histidine kinase
VSDDERTSQPAIGDVLALVVHDLRNPVAMLSANLSFVQEVLDVQDPDAAEALEDVEVAVGELTRGLEQLGWVGRWLGGGAALEGAPGDARAAVQAGIARVGARVPADLHDGPLSVAAAGGALERLVELLLRNALKHAPEPTVRVALKDAGEEVHLEIRDGGPAIGRDLRERVFTLRGQRDLKGRADGRYSRVVGLLAARALADALGARLEADEADGEAVFRVRLAKGG